MPVSIKQNLPSTAKIDHCQSANLLDRAFSKLLKARGFLIDNQKSDGHWVAELQGDTILESEFVLLMAFLGRENEEICKKCAKYIQSQIIPEGGWSNFEGGPFDLSVSVKAYFALKLTGVSIDLSWMKLARQKILEAGGAENCNSFSRFYLALLGEYSYQNCPEVPPELVLLPSWFPVSIYLMSSWTRTILVPLSIFSAIKPSVKLAKEKGIRELFVSDPWQAKWPSSPSPEIFSWRNFFLLADLGIKKIAPKLPFLRNYAVKKAALWMREHFHMSDGVGAIFPPMIYTVVALKCLGVEDSSPEMKWALKQLSDLVIEENESVRLQPCVSPVWDTALATIAVADAGQPEDDFKLKKSVDWLMKKEVTLKVDCATNHPDMKPAGWFFEYNNQFYPDIDDTAMVIIAMVKSKNHMRPECVAAIERAVRWMFLMQNKDGGWGAFDKDIDQEFLTKVPFADHNAMLDPTCPDITARVLEALGFLGYTADEIHIQKAIDYIRCSQEPWGAWVGRWGVNYIYGTWQVLLGLESIGFDMHSPMVLKAVEWLKSCQQEDGSWGETCATYNDPSLAGQGDPTPSQTAWAILGLIAAGEGKSDAVKNGISYLANTQNRGGDWSEKFFTGTGFPKVFYLKYHYYRVYFPLMALSRFCQLNGYNFDK